MDVDFAFHSRSCLSSSLWFTEIMGFRHKKEKLHPPHVLAHLECSHWSALHTCPLYFLLRRCLIQHRMPVSLMAIEFGILVFARLFCCIIFQSSKYSPSLCGRGKGAGVQESNFLTLLLQIANCKSCGS